MDRPIAFRKIESGHYAHAETGITIRHSPKRTIGRNGWRVAGWTVEIPRRTGGTVEQSFHHTLTAAKASAAAPVIAYRNLIAAAYADATAEEISRVAIAVNTSDRKAPTALLAKAMVMSARKSWLSGDYARARSFAREAEKAFADRIRIDHKEAIAENSERASFVQLRDWTARHDLLSGRPEHVNPAIGADHEEAIADDRSRSERLGYFQWWAQDDNEEFLHGCTFVGDGWDELHRYEYDRAVIVRRRAHDDGATRCGAHSDDPRHGPSDADMDWTVEQEERAAGLPSAQAADYSEEPGEVIHFWPAASGQTTGPERSDLSACDVDVMHTPYTFGSPEWAEVTCGPCLATFTSRSGGLTPPVVRVAVLFDYAADVDAVREHYRDGRYSLPFSLGMISLITGVTEEGARVLLDASSTASLA